MKRSLAAVAALAFVVAGCGGSDTDSAAEPADGSGQGDSASDESPPVGSDEVVRGCPASTVPGTGYPAEGFGTPRSLTVCLYQQDDGGALGLTGSVELGAKPAEQVARAVALGARTECPAPGADDAQQVLLRVETENDFGAEPLMRDYLVRLDDCPSVVDLTESDLRGGPTPVAVSARLLAPWAGEDLTGELDLGSLPEELVEPSTG